LSTVSFFCCLPFCSLFFLLPASALNFLARKGGASLLCYDGARRLVAGCVVVSDQIAAAFEAHEIHEAIGLAPVNSAARDAALEFYGCSRLTAFQVKFRGEGVGACFVGGLSVSSLLCPPFFLLPWRKALEFLCFFFVFFCIS
jgi:hypothetical protein